MNKPTMWVLVGLSGSGKSTIATQIANENPNTVIVSSDAIREELTGNYEDQEHNEEVFKIFHDRIRKNLENKKNVIADATNLTMKSSRAIMMKVNGLNIRKVCVIIPKPFEQCGELIAKMKDFDQKNPHHTMTLENHCFNTYDLFTEKGHKAEYNMGAVLHDYGKLYCQTIDENGIAHYYDHPSVGCYLVLENLMEGFNKAVLDICLLINYHMMPFSWDTDKAKQR